MMKDEAPKSDQLKTRAARRDALLRFVWQTDGDGRFDFPDADEVIAALLTPISGSIWAGDETVRSALDARATFVGIETFVTLEDKAPARIILSGTPLTSTTGVFTGFRGFGFIEPPVMAVTPIIAPQLEPKSEPKRAVEPSHAATVGLSESERQAFRDIARALGAKSPEFDSVDVKPVEKAERDAVGKPTTAQGSASPAPALLTEPFVGLTRQMSDILDRLPVGLLISRGGVPIVMNRPLLDWLGYTSTDHFYESGNIDTLFGGRDPSRRSTDDEGAMLLRRYDSDMIALGVKLQTLQWDGLPASMMVFEPLTDREETDWALNPEAEPRASGVSAFELSTILDTATDGVIVLDNDGRVLSLNRSAEALFGLDTAQIAGEKITALLSDDSRGRALDYLEGLKHNGVASVLNDGREVTGQTRDGGRIPLFMTMGRIGTPAEPKFCAVLRDITSFKRAERDFIDARRAAETASARKSDFLARISHEIRTPLSAIIGFAEIMHEERFGQVGNERYREYLGDILTSGRHVLGLVNDLLDLSKIEAGRADLTFSEVDINKVLLGATHLVQEAANKGRVVLRLSLASHVPALVADERSLTQIMLNLLSNAIKFTPEGGQVIVSTAKTSDGEVVIRIKDTGIGMTETDIATALEPFRQVTTTRQGGGTGLGLPLTKALVEANRASMAIRSARYTGTLVEITFPPTRVLADR
jgi:PAS domain S-box-containing protein